MVDFDARLPAHSQDRIGLAGLMLGTSCIGRYNTKEFLLRQAPWMSREYIEEVNPFDIRLTDRPFHENCTAVYKGGWDYVPFARWLARQDVRSAFHAHPRSGQSFGGCQRGCVSVPDFDWRSFGDPVHAISRLLEAGVNVTLYYGLNSLACNYASQFKHLSSALTWRGVELFHDAPFVQVSIDGVQIGRMKSVAFQGANLAWMELLEASHMVPRSHPSAGFHVLRTHLGLLPNREASKLRVHSLVHRPVLLAIVVSLLLLVAFLSPAPRRNLVLLL